MMRRQTLAAPKTQVRTKPETRAGTLVSSRSRPGGASGREPIFDLGKIFETALVIEETGGGLNNIAVAPTILILSYRPVNQLSEGLGSTMPFSGVHNATSRGESWIAHSFM